MSATTNKFGAVKFSQRMDGKAVNLYVAAVPAEVLVDRVKVDIYHAGNNPDGYQREPVAYRVKDIARYVEKREGVLPTAMLVNVRDGAAFEPAGGDVGGMAIGTVTIPADEPIWLVDGQHRLAGLTEAAKRISASDAKASLGYDVPVVFSLGLDRYAEMRLFDIVNSNAKSIETALAAQLLREAVLREGKGFVHTEKGTERDFRKAIGTAVAFHLNGTPGAWQGRIRLPNEGKNTKQKPLQVNAIASSLEPPLRDAFMKTLYEPEIEIAREWPTVSGLVHTYWDALADLMPDAFADIERYSIQRTAGAYAMHLIFTDVLYRCRDRRDYSLKTFVQVLKPLGKWVESDTWRIEGGDPLTKSTGMSAIRELADNIREKLEPMEMPGLVEIKAPAAVTS